MIARRLSSGTVSIPPSTGELVVLAGGLVLLLILNLLLLRPVDELADYAIRRGPVQP